MGWMNIFICFKKNKQSSLRKEKEKGCMVRNRHRSTNLVPSCLGLVMLENKNKGKRKGKNETWGLVGALCSIVIHGKRKTKLSSPPASIPVPVLVPIFNVVSTADSDILQQPAERAPAAE